MLDILDNLKIRTKLVILLAWPIIALVLFAGSGYSQRTTVASRATSDEKIVNAAAATSDLIGAMEREAMANVYGVATSTRPPQLTKLQQETDAAIETFKKENGRLDLNGNSTSVSAASNALSTLSDSTVGNFKNFREGGLSNITWKDQLGNYTNSSIQAFVSYVQNLAGLTSTPEVVLPLEQLASLLDYNLQTVALTTMTMTTRHGGEGTWIDPNRALVFAQAGRQDKANAVLARVAGSQSAIGTYFNRHLKTPASLDTVLSNDWQIPQVMNTFTAEAEALAFPSVAVPLDDAQSYARQLAGAATDLTGRTKDYIESSRADAVRSARIYALGGGLAIVVAIAAAIWISRSITQRVTRLTDAADRLSHEQLPRLVDSLKNPAEEDVGYLTSSFSEIDVKGTDEVGQLAGAFNRIQGVAVQVATEQAQLLRKGIGDMFVNLARRNQGLLDRQIEFIDQLESAEEDPDQLENLFRLDHLATRMRRNAESLLVLAGAEPSRRRGKPVPLADVVRAAVGEVEDFARIDMLQFDDVLVASNAALDIAHLLSELMENAANFSPPDTRVEVVGHRTKAEGYVISVTDHGIGISPEALAEANDLLARPPLVGLALSRSLGFIVIGRLAARFGIAVRLMPSPSSGTTAMVSLPPALITDQPKTPTGPGEITDRAREREREAAPAASSGDAKALAEGADRRPAARRRKPAEVPTDQPGDSSATPAAASETAPPAAKAMPRRRVAAVPDEPAEEASDDPVSEAAPTAAGLTKRVPRAAGGQRAVPGGDGTRSATQNRRSPEEVRSMLSRYRTGMQKGRTDDDENPTTPEDHPK